MSVGRRDRVCDFESISGESCSFDCVVLAHLLGLAARRQSLQVFSLNSKCSLWRTTMFDVSSPHVAWWSWLTEGHFNLLRKYRFAGIRATEGFAIAEIMSTFRCMFGASKISSACILAVFFRLRFCSKLIRGLGAQQQYGRACQALEPLFNGS